MSENTELTAPMVAKVLTIKKHRAWRMLKKVKDRKELTERKPTVKEFCTFYKYDLSMFLTDKK